MAEISTKPYLIRAIHEWCTDSGFTPYLAVSVDNRTMVPREHVRNGEIVLNVSVMATNKLSLGNEFIEFQARFGGTPRELSIPIENVTAVYARENGHGMAFEVPKALAVADDDAPLDAPAGEADEPSTDAPADTERSAPRRAPARRKGPRLVPVSSDASPPPGEVTGDALDTPRRVDGPRVAPAATPEPAVVPDTRSTDVQGQGEASDTTADPVSGAPDRSDGPDDRGPAPGRPRLTRIK